MPDAKEWTFFLNIKKLVLVLGLINISFRNTVVEGCRTTPKLADQLRKFKENRFEQSIKQLSPNSTADFAMYGTEIYTVPYTRGYTDRKIHRYNLADGSHMTYETEHTRDIFCVDASKQLVVTGSSDKTVRIWNRANMEQLYVLTDHTHTVYACKLFENLLITSSRDKTAIVYKMIAQGQPKQQYVLKGHTKSVYAVDANAEYIATASLDKTVKIWNRRTGALYKTMTGHSSYVYSVRFLDASHAASTSYDRKLIIWDVDTGTAIKTLDHGDDWGYLATHSGLIYTTRDKPEYEVLVWDYTAGAESMPEEPIKIIKTKHTNLINAIDATDTTIVTCDGYGAINIIQLDP